METHEIPRLARFGPSGEIVRWYGSVENIHSLIPQAEGNSRDSRLRKIAISLIH